MSLLFKTRNMEGAARILTGRLRHVRAHIVYRAERPIWFRPGLISDLEPNVYIRRWGRQYDRQVDAWKERGGLLLDYLIEGSELLSTDGLMICEAPYSWKELQLETYRAKEATVVYEPPIWKPHFTYWDASNPSSATCLRLMELLEEHTILTPLQQAVAEILGLPDRRIAAMFDTDLQKHLDVGQVAVNAALNALKIASRMKPSRTAMLLSVRVEPDDPTLMEVYNFVDKCLPSVSGNIKVSTGDLMKKSGLKWRNPMRKLINQGCIAKKGRVQFVFVDALKPSYEQIDVDRDMARKKLEHMIAKVAKLPELD